MTEQNTHSFIRHLQSLAEGKDRAALAALRRGQGQPPGTVAEMYRYVVPFLPDQPSRAMEAACYLIASLFALHPKSTGAGNLGTHLRACDPERKNDDALERRFTILLAAHPDDLPDLLRQTISFIKSKEIPVNWNQLFWDLQNWEEKREDPRWSVQKQWANAFWARPTTE